MVYLFVISRHKKSKQTLALLIESGNVLFSHIVANALPSAIRSLTAVFGMCTGVSFPLSSPEIAEYIFTTLTFAYIYSI